MSKFLGARSAGAIAGCLLATAVTWLMLASVARAVTLTRPTIAGTPQQGQTLTLTVPGTPTPSTATITNQWERCTSGTCAAIAKQTAGTYTLTLADVGHTIDVLETATDASAPPSPATSVSNSLGPVTGNTAPPKITGIAQEGQLLTLTRGTWTNSPASISDQWMSCLGTSCAVVGTANSLTYQPVPTDVGHTIHVVETAGSLTANSAAVGPVAPLSVPVNTVPPVISGAAQQGQTLTLTQGGWINTPSAITDQWEQCTAIGGGCTPIPGQTGPTYTLGPGDVGHTLQVVETAANDGGPGLPSVSLGSAVVTATSFASVVAVSANSPTTNQTVTLVATVTSSSGNADPSGSMAFFNGPNGIAGCGGKPVKGHQTVTVICQASFPAGTATVSATYQPGSGSLVEGSTSAPTSFGVGRDSTSISLAVTKQVVLGKRATYSATLVPPTGNSGPIGPTGSMEFFDRGQPIPTCVGQPLSALTATCTVKYRVRGTHQISALYAGDVNFAASTSSAGSVQIVRSSTAPTVSGFVTSTLQWTWSYHPTYTQVAVLKAFRLAKGTSLLLTCQGAGCPFGRLNLAGKSAATINLVPRFRHRHLRAGTRVTVRLTHQHWVGKYYSFTIRAGRPPLIDLSCLGVGRAVPGVGC